MAGAAGRVRQTAYDIRPGEPPVEKWGPRPCVRASAAGTDRARQARSGVDGQHRRRGHPDETGAPKKTVPEPSEGPATIGPSKFVWLPRMPERARPTRLRQYRRRTMRRRAGSGRAAPSRTRTAGYRGLRRASRSRTGSRFPGPLRHAPPGGQSGRAGPVGDRAIKDIPEGPPPPVVGPEHPPVGQDVLGDVGPRLKQELRDGPARRDGRHTVRKTPSGPMPSARSPT